MSLNNRVVAACSIGRPARLGLLSTDWCWRVTGNGYQTRMARVARDDCDRLFLRAR